MPGRRVEAEGDVGHAERRLHLRVAPLDLADRLDRLQAVAAGLLLAGGDREGQAVDEDVLDVHPPVAGEGRRSAAWRPRTLWSAVRAWPSSSMVSATTAAPCSRTIGMIRANRLPGPVAVLVVDRVDDRAAAEQLEPGLDHGGLGRVEHERQRRGWSRAGRRPRFMSATPSRPT